MKPKILKEHPRKMDFEFFRKAKNKPPNIEEAYYFRFVEPPPVSAYKVDTYGAYHFKFNR